MAHPVKFPGGGTGISIGPQSPEEIQGIITRRHHVAMDYCKKKGWPTDPESLSWDQILEIRELPEWKLAGKAAN